MHIQADHLGDVEEFDDIDTTATTFHRGDDGLVSIEFLGKVGLAQACTFTLLDDEVDQADMSR